jgi:hypothetical protein
MPFQSYSDTSRECHLHLHLHLHIWSQLLQGLTPGRFLVTIPTIFHQLARNILVHYQSYGIMQVVDLFRNWGWTKFCYTFQPRDELNSVIPLSITQNHQLVRNLFVKCLSLLFMYIADSQIPFQKEEMMKICNVSDVKAVVYNKCHHYCTGWFSGTSVLGTRENHSMSVS